MKFLFRRKELVLICFNMYSILYGFTNFNNHKIYKWAISWHQEFLEWKIFHLSFIWWDKVWKTTRTGIYYEVNSLVSFFFASPWGNSWKLEAVLLLFLVKYCFYAFSVIGYVSQGYICINYRYSFHSRPKSLSFHAKQDSSPSNIKLNRQN